MALLQTSTAAEAEAEVAARPTFESAGRPPERNALVQGEPAAMKTSAVAREVAGGLALRLARYPLQALFVFVVPPILGPEPYSTYATCIALWALVVEATNLGTVPLFGRVLPSLDHGSAALLIRQVLWTRLGLAAVPGLGVLALLWTPTPEAPALFWLVVVAVLACTVQQVLFGALYGRGEIRRFMACDPLRSGLSLVLVVPAFVAFGVTGAVGAISAAQVLLAGLAAYWLRIGITEVLPPATWAGLGWACRFGVAAALPTTLMIVATKLGTPLLSRAGRAAEEIAGFDLATHGFSLVAALVAYPFVALTPTLGRAADAERGHEVDAWLRRAAARVAAIAVVGIYCLAGFGEPLMRMLLGEPFALVYPNALLLVGAGVFPLLIAQTGITIALIERKPARTVIPAVLLVLITASATIFLASWPSGLGAAAALVLGVAAQATAMVKLIPGLASLVLKPVGLGLVASLPALVLGVVVPAPIAVLSGPARIGGAIALGLIAAWIVARGARAEIERRAA